MNRRTRHAGWLTLVLFFTSVPLAMAGGPKTPIDLSKVKPETINLEILRTGMVAELNAVNMYEQLAATASDPAIKKSLLNIAAEEKVHMGEFETLLLQRDQQLAKALKKAKAETKKLEGK